MDGDMGLTDTPDSPQMMDPATLASLGGGGMPQLPQQPPPSITQGVTPSADPNTVEAMATAVHHNRLAEAANAVGNILGGSKTVHLTKHPDGTVEITHDPSTGGEKWGRVAAAALSGAAKGWAVGQGPGGAGRAAGTGFEAGQDVQKAPEEQARQQVEQSQKDVLFNANHAALDQQYVRNAELMKQSNLKWNQDQMDRYNAVEQAVSKAPGSEVLGSFAGVNDLPSFVAKYPQAMKGHVLDQNSYLNFFPQADGKTQVVFMNKPMGEQIMKDPPPIPTDYFDSATNTIKTRDVKPTEGITWNDYNTAVKGTQVANSKLALDVAEKLHPIPKTLAEIRLAEQTETNPARKAQLKQAGDKIQQDEITQKTAGRNVTVNPYTAPPGTNPATVQTATKSGQPIWGQNYGGGDPNSAFENTARQLALGEKTEDSIPKRYAKGQPSPMDYSNRARQITEDMFGKDFEYNPAQISKEFKDYSSGKWTAAYNAMDRLAGRPDGTSPTGDPPLLTQLEQAAKQSGLGPNAPVNDIIQWTKRKWGNDAAKALQFDLAETQKSLGQVTGNPTLGSSDTNLKLQQMQEAYGQDMTLSNLRKTNREARKAIAAERQAGFTNNRFLRRAYGGEAVTDRPSGPTGGAPPVDQSNPPPIALLPAGHDTVLDPGDGTAPQTWRNVNNKPVRVK